MNTYLIPVTEPYGYELCYRTLVHANSPQEAYDKAKQMPEIPYPDHIISKNFKLYAAWNRKLQISTPFFHISKKHDIITEMLHKSGLEGYDNMASAFWDTFYMGDYNKTLEYLANIALPELWSFPAEKDYFILKNYLQYTFDRLQEENKIITTDKHCVFNTGLFTKNYEEIYFIAEKPNANMSKPWTFKEFCTEYGLDDINLQDLPQRANYFEDPSLLVFDWNCPVRIQYNHILDNPNNQARLPKSVMESKMRLQLFIGVIDTSIKKVIANYILAVPQYYDGKIQLLIPLYFEDDNKPELALTLTKKNGYYQGSTCLTLKMAYNNARLITRPESNWLANTIK